MAMPQKRSAQSAEDPEIRLLIPSKVAGCIIGKGGKNITRLRSLYNAAISIPDCPGPERVVSISADYETALKVIEEMTPNIEECLRISQRGKSDDLDLKVLVHQSQAGCIIGKGGTKIKELRDKTGARIKIFSSCCPHSSDRVVAIAGSGAVCLSAIKEVIDLVKETPIKGFIEQYDPHNFDDEYADEYGGYGIGMRTGGLRDGLTRRSPPGAPVMLHYPSAELPRQIGRGQLRGSQTFASFGGVLGGGGTGGIGSMGRGSLRLGNRGPNQQNNFDREFDDVDVAFDVARGSNVQGNAMGNGNNATQQHTPGQGAPSGAKVTIPKDLAGAIIGKSGTRIRKIRADSGAAITIDEPLPGSSERIITISGSPTQIQMAQYLLQQSVHESLGGRY